MYPVLFHVGSISIYSWGVVFAATLLACAILVRIEIKRQGLNPDITYDLILLAAVGGLVGARVFYVLGHWNYYAQTPIRIFNISEGGLVFYGGLGGGTLAILLYVKAKSLPIWKIADLAAPALAMGAAIGRVGCLLNGCCYGKPSRVPWAIFLAGMPRHPTQIYEILMNLAIFTIIWFWRRKFTQEGLIFWLYLFLYSAARFNVEFLRETRAAALGLSASQLISIGIFLIASGHFFWVYQSPIKKKGF